MHDGLWGFDRLRASRANISIQRKVRIPGGLVHFLTKLKLGDSIRFDPSTIKVW